MVWEKNTFLEALRDYLNYFKSRPTSPRLALVWRTPDEYSIMEEWFLDQIKREFDGSTLRVLMWLNHEEAAELLDMLRGSASCL